MILRRVLMFLVFLGAGLGLLALVIGGDGLFDFRGRESVDAATGEAPSEGIEFDASGDRTKKRQGVPERLRVVPRGRGKLEPRQPPVERPSGKVLNVPEFTLEWQDAQPRGGGTYRLSGVDLTVYERIEPKEPRARVVARGSASWMDVVAAQEGQTFAIDKQHAMEMHGVDLDVMASGLRRASRLRADEKRGVTLKTERLTARLLESRLRLDGPPDERVEIRARGGDGSELVITGNGMRADLETGDRRSVTEEDESAPRPSWAILQRAVRVRALQAGATGSRERFVLEGDGPLRLDVAGEHVQTIDLRGDIRFEGAFEDLAGGSRPGLSARGERLLAWIRSGIAGGRSTGADPMVTDVAVFGGDGPARLEMGEQRMLAQRVDVVLDAFGDPDRVTASGEPRLIVADRTGRVLGTVFGHDRIRWRRPVLSARLGLRGFGLDLDGLLRGSHAGTPFFPEEWIHVGGPAEFRPEENDGPVRSCRAERGVVVPVARRLGRREPVLVLGLGAVELSGVLPGRRGGPFTATGTRGFALGREPGTSTLRGWLGPPVPDAEHLFAFHAGRDHVSGRGWVSFSATDPSLADLVPERETRERAGESAGESVPRSFTVRFVAAVSEQLRWKRTEPEADVELAGVKSATLSSRPDGTRALAFSGVPLVLEDRARGLVARAEAVTREGSGPWLLRRSFQPVELRLPPDGERPPAVLRADRATVWVQPGWVPVPRARPDVWVHAEGSVHASTLDAGDGLEAELFCDDLVHYPGLAPRVVESVARDVVGGAGEMLHPVLFGSRNGFYRASGRVRVVARQRAGTPGAGVAVRELRGETLYLDVARGLGRFLLLPRAGAVVSGRLDEPGQGTLRFTGGRLAGRGKELVLSGSAGHPPRIWLTDGREAGGDGVVEAMARRGRTGRTLRLTASGPVRWIDRVLRFPGPVTAESVDGRDEAPADGFVLRCTDELRVELGPPPPGRSPSPELAAWDLPGSVDFIAARGDVEISHRGISAAGDTLAFDPETGWLELATTDAEPVRVAFGGGFRSESHPSIRVNLKTRAVRSGRGRAAGVFRGPR